MQTVNKRELRFLITSDCNYACYFCHLEGMSRELISKKFKLLADDYAFIFEEFKKSTGCNTVTLTGGEPFIRRDILDIVRKLKEKGAVITIVTNGSLLPVDGKVYEFIDRLNISLHTMEADKYKSMTKNGILQMVLSNIEFVKKNFVNVDITLNTVMSGTNYEIEELVKWSSDREISIKFIELYPSDCDGFRSMGDIEDLLKENNSDILKTSGTSRQHAFKSNNRKIVLTQITCAKAMEQKDKSPREYCRQNQDVFITPDGNIKTCMNTSDVVAIAKAVKNRDSSEVLERLAFSIDCFGNGCSSKRLNGSY